jgi:hypothetical protein
MLTISGNDGGEPIKVLSSAAAQGGTEDQEDNEGGLASIVGAPSALNANGEWKRTEVKQAEEATLKISNQGETSFAFELAAKNGEKSGSVSGTAEFLTENAAVFNAGNEKATLKFTFSGEEVSVTHTGNDTDLGCDSTVTFDGSYTQGNPEYKDADTGKNNPAYSKDLIKSQLILTSIKSALSKDDFAVYQAIMTDENIRDMIPPSELKYDKDGNKICVDEELDAIKYQAVVTGAGTEALLACKPDGKIYLGLYMMGEVRYYTNDGKYKNTPPKCMKTFAESRGAELKNLTK